MDSEDWADEVKSKISTIGNLKREVVNIRIDSSSALKSLFQNYRLAATNNECVPNFSVKDMIRDNKRDFRKNSSKVWERIIGDKIQMYHTGAVKENHDRLNKLYRYCFFLTKDRKKALKLFRKAIIMGNDKANYIDRKNLEKEEKMALEVLRFNERALESDIQESKKIGKTEYEEESRIKVEEAKQDLERIRNIKKASDQELKAVDYFLKLAPSQRTGFTFSRVEEAEKTEEEEMLFNRFLEDENYFLENYRTYFHLFAILFARREDLNVMTRDKLHTYNIILILNGSVVKEPGMWGDVAFNGTEIVFKEGLLGILCLLNNKSFFEDIKNKMLSLTKNKPYLRVPIYKPNCDVYWP